MNIKPWTDYDLLSWFLQQTKDGSSSSGAVSSAGAGASATASGVASSSAPPVATPTGTSSSGSGSGSSGSGSDSDSGDDEDCDEDEDEGEDEDCDEDNGDDDEDCDEDEDEVSFFSFVASKVQPLTNFLHRVRTRTAKMTAAPTLAALLALVRLLVLANPTPTLATLLALVRLLVPANRAALLALVKLLVPASQIPTTAADRVQARLLAQASRTPTTATPLVPPPLREQPPLRRPHLTRTATTHASPACVAAPLPLKHPTLWSVRSTTTSSLTPSATGRYPLTPRCSTSLLVRPPVKTRHTEELWPDAQLWPTATTVLAEEHMAAMACLVSFVVKVNSAR